MKIRYFTFIAILLILTSCNPNNPTPNPPTPTPPTSNPVQTSWTMTVDNNTYSWADNYITEGGGNSFSSYLEHYDTNPGSCNWQLHGFPQTSGEIHLSTSNLPGFTEDGLDCTIKFYPYNTGSFIINGTSNNSSSPSNFAIFISDYPVIQNIASPGMEGSGCQINTNITTFSTVPGGLVEGNFSGTFKDTFGQTHTVSGQFSAIRTE